MSASVSNSPATTSPLANASFTASASTEWSASQKTQPAAAAAYLVERELEPDGNGALKALVADYVEQAERHGVIPMHVPLGRYLAHVED